MQAALVAADSAQNTPSSSERVASGRETRMSRDGSIELEFGGRKRLFRLGIAEWDALDDELKIGPEELAARLSPTVQAMRLGLGLDDAARHGLVGGWRRKDLRAVIYRGLIGGDPALGALEADRLVRDLVDPPRPLREGVLLAYAVVMAALDGVPDDPVGETQGARPRKPRRAPSAASASATSTAPAVGSAKRRKKSAS